MSVDLTKLDYERYLRGRGWAVKGRRQQLVPHPTKEGATIPVGKVASAFVRVHTFGMDNVWFFARLYWMGDDKNRWRVVISWRSLGVDHQLTSHSEVNVFDLAVWAEEHLKNFEAQTRLGWRPRP